MIDDMVGDVKSLSLDDDILLVNDLLLVVRSFLEAIELCVLVTFKVLAVNNGYLCRIVCYGILTSSSVVNTIIYIWWCFGFSIM